MKKILFCLLLVAVSLASCRPGRTSGVREGGTADSVRYARGFRIEPRDGYTCVEIANPWDTGKVLHRYVLVPSDRPLPASLPAGTLIRTPLRRVVVYTSVHCSLMDVLGVHEEVAGVCGSRYMDVGFVKEGLAGGRIADLGESVQPDMEKMIEIAPDAVFTSPIDDQAGYGRLEKIGVPIVECVDYMETHPLAPSDWVKLFGLLFGREAEADSLFRSTAEAYDRTKRLADSVKTRPTLLAEYRMGPAWYVPGGRSYMAAIYRDAGADYLWDDTSDTGSVPLSFEHVLERAAGADVWVMKYNRPEDMTYADLKADYAGYALFDAFRNKSVFACNTGRTTYYEDLTVHPDYILKDLVWVLHPELLPDYTPRYFARMRD